MEVLRNVSLLEISANGAKNVILVLEINGKIKKFDVKLLVSDEIFGVDFSNELGLALRNYPQVSQHLVKLIDGFRHNKNLELPEVLLEKQKLPELQAA